MFNLLLALMLTTCPDSAAINWTGFDAEADCALDRAEARTDAKVFNMPAWCAELDSLIQVNHDRFTKRHRLKIASQISRARADEATLIGVRGADVKMLADLLALHQTGLLRKAFVGDSVQTVEVLKLIWLQTELIDALIDYRR